jgi:hypothetical protein
MAQSICRPGVPASGSSMTSGNAQPWSSNSTKCKVYGSFSGTSGVVRSTSACGGDAHTLLACLAFVNGRYGCSEHAPIAPTTIARHAKRSQRRSRKRRDAISALPGRRVGLQFGTDRIFMHPRVGDAGERPANDRSAR